MFLSVENLSVSYGNIKALHGINFQVDEGEIVCPNCGRASVATQVAAVRGQRVLVNRLAFCVDTILRTRFKAGR